MNVKEINEHLLRGAHGASGVLPHLDRLGRASHVFRFEFGLDALPGEPGVLLIRGARQYGKSTWLESSIRDTVETHGPGSALYMNGDELGDAGELMETIRDLTPLFTRKARVRRLFIDEITAVTGWERALKRLLDAGELDGILVVTTGSRASDLRRGAERLPGRKGRLARTTWLFTPISYREFHRVCAPVLGGHTLVAYLLSGGSPMALNELATTRTLPEFVIETVRDWILGETARSGRHRASLFAVMNAMLRYGGSPLGQAKLAREADLANNTVAAGYVELLEDLLCVATAHAWDASRKRVLRRRPCKFHLINLLAAAAWHPSRPRTMQEFLDFKHAEQGRWYEWLVAQELWRRAAIRGGDSPEEMAFWRSDEHELDFVLGPDEFLEVKRGPVSPMEMAWFPRSFPRGRLTVVCASSFETDRMRALPLHDFLMEG